MKLLLRNEIVDNWSKDIVGHLQKIRSIDGRYSAYTIKTEFGYGVAIPMDKELEVNEDFSNAKLRTQVFFQTQEDESHLYLTLITNQSTDKCAFSALCEQFVYPGEHGEFREEIIEAPLKWWMEMKQILGNKNVDSMIYDTLGELWAYDYLIRMGKQAVWNGPKGSSVDIEAEDMMIEVKSTLSRSKREITVHGKSQLTIPQNKRLFLYLCVFEMTTKTGCSINDIVYGLANDGYDVSEINSMLAQKGLELGKSARDKKYILWNVYKYTVDDNFPRITGASFVGGKEPEGITSISYTVNLDGIPCEIIVEENEH